MGQPWAGGTWGHQVIPRVGMECLVSYQEGDPDRPFIMALVPDPTNPTPYPLPDNKTRMVFRSNSWRHSGLRDSLLQDATEMCDLKCPMAAVLTFSITPRIK